MAIVAADYVPLCRNTQRLRVVFAILLVAVFATAAQANLLDDGSLELATDNSTTSNSAWTLAANLPNGSEPSAVFSTSVWAASDGATGVWFKPFLATAEPANATLSQTVSGVAGGSYSLTFQAAREINFLATSAIASLSSSGTGGSDTVDLATAVFNNTANMESDPTTFTLSISGVSPGDDLTVSVNLLDGIPNPGASESLMVDNFNLVPEPTSIAVAAMGIVGILALRRRR